MHFLFGWLLPIPSTYVSLVAYLIVIFTGGDPSIFVRIPLGYDLEMFEAPLSPVWLTPGTRKDSSVFHTVQPVLFCSHRPLEFLRVK